MLDHTLTATRSRFRRERFYGRHYVSACRWNNIVQGNLDYQQTEFDWPNFHNAHLQIVQGSSKAFLVLGSSRTTWYEVDMRRFPISLSTELQSDATGNKAERVLHSQISSDGHYLGWLYWLSDETTSNEETLLVQVTDLRLSMDETTYIKLRENFADDSLDWLTIRNTTFNSDLSMLFLKNNVYDLSLTTHETTATRFSWPTADETTSPTEVLFSPCNRFLCLIEKKSRFKIYKLCRSTKTLRELCVDGARFSNPIRYGPIGKFHPHLPILLLSGRSESIKWIPNETGQIEGYEIIEVDLSSLKAHKLPPPCLIPPLRGIRRMEIGHTFDNIEFPDCGRLAWLSIWGEYWCQIPQRYPPREEHGIDHMPFVSQNTLMYDGKIYKVSERGGYIKLELWHRVDDRELETQNAHVRITSIPYTMRNCDSYLLPGHREEDLARVLLVSHNDDKRTAMIKTLPITMKAILVKLDEVAENLRTQKQISEMPSDSTSEPQNPDEKTTT